MNIDGRLKLLRELMKKNGIDAFIVSSSDNHLSEYVSDYFKCREWISGFTGSAGTAVITMREAHLWVDGRYHIQAEKQVKGSSFIVEKMGTAGVKKYTEWICDNIRSKKTVGFNGKVMAANDFKEIKSIAEKKNFNIKVVDDLFEAIWVDRPSFPMEKVFVHTLNFAGKNTVDKLTEVREKMKEYGAAHYLIASLVDIAWLLNLRGNDAPNNPIFLSYLLMDMNKCTLYIDKSKLTKEVMEYLDSSSVSVKQYDQISEDLSKLKKKDVIMFDPSKTNVWLTESIKDNISIIEKRDITTDLKARKNSIEIENLERCQIKDGTAMVKFVYWLQNNIGKIEITEISASDKLEELRREQEYNLGISFDTIAAFGSNAAMMHYKATPDNNAKLEQRGFFLVDSGGQYLDGTTDITRTFTLGALTDEMREDYTLVLKSHIALNKTIFLYGASGANIDIIARRPLWERGLDYKCGTGHGVGYLLGVHEGPQSIRQDYNDVKLEEGMIITNEPGIYKEGKHGIRIENTMLVKNHMETEFGKFMRFDVISYCPIDLTPVKLEMLTEEEKQWINDYHKMVYNKLNKNLDSKEKEFLAELTKAI
jgi:Xaa-Pro aminopeptidase